MSGADIAVAVLELAAVAAEKGWFERLRNALRERHRVLVLGSTGVGKTNLLKALTEPLPEAIDAINRSEFATKHKLSLAKQPFEFIDTPGQLLHEKRRNDSIREEMAKGRLGILSVNAYGYHEYEVARDQAFENDGTTSSEYLAAHRRIELDFVRSWASLLGDRGTSKWLITVVTKADLWWEAKRRVLEHYQTGDYFTALGPAQTLNPVTVEFCSVVHRFYGRGPVSSTFDDDNRARVKARLYQALIQAVAS